MTKFDALPPKEAYALLGSLIGQKIVSIHRIVRYPLDQLAADLKVHDSSDYFRLAPGDIFFRFDSGQCVRAGSDARRKTVLLSSTDITPEEEAEKPDYLGRGGIVLSAEDVRYSDIQIQNLLRKKIENIGIIFVDDGDLRSTNQRGISFYIENQKGIILGLQLRKNRVAHLSFLEFDDLNADLHPFLRQTGIDGESLPLSSPP